MIEVISPGPLAVLQDLGRFGYRQLGVGRSGAADQRAHRLANRLVGNAESAATVEFTLGGLAIRLLTPATIAFAGARCGGAPGWQQALTLPAGRTIALTPPATGLRGYLAVRGGIAVEPVLGSRSTDLLAGLGPPPLVAGSRLPVGVEVSGPPAGDPVPVDDRPVDRIAVLPGPRAVWFAEPAELFARPWRVTPDSNRIGVRLTGEPLRRQAGELPPEPMLPGAIQVPPSGQPIVLFRDAPVTGGYPVIGVLPSAELDRLAQLRPGDQLRLVPAGQ